MADAIDVAGTPGTAHRLIQSLAPLLESANPRERAALDRALVILNDAPLSKETAFLLDPPEAVLNGEDVAIFNRLFSYQSIPVAVPKPTTYMVMKSTRLCNLRCTYCHSWKEGPNQVMSFEVLARATRDILRSPNARSVNFVWHGGEATVLPLAFYKTALWLQYAFKCSSTKVSNSLQTNATRLTAEWIQFIKTCRISVGVSIDGPPEIHDACRHDRSGRGTSDKVVEGISRLQEAGIPFGALLVITDRVVNYGPERLLEYLVQIGITNIAILNVLPENSGGLGVGSPNYLPWPNFVAYLIDLFRIWWSGYREKIHIRELASLVNSLRGQPALVCEFAGDCMGQFLTIEPNGDISACDKYIGDGGYVFGNVVQNELPIILANSNNLRAVRAESLSRAERMKKCDNFAFCAGGCPHDMRLNERNVPGWDGQCCGLTPLFEVMRAVLKSSA